MHDHHWRVSRTVEAAPWDAFVEAADHSTLFHSASWQRVLQQAFDIEIVRLGAWRGETLVGVLPLGIVRRPLAGSVIISLPFAVHAGVITDDPQAGRRLEQSALDLAAERGAAYVELRGREPGALELPTTRHFYTFERTLDPDPEVNLRNVPRKQRAMVRKGIGQGLEAVAERELSTFHALYARSVRNLGTPIYPKRYFEALARVLGDTCEILTVYAGGRAVSSVPSFRHRDRLMPYYAGGLPDARRLHAFDYMYWMLMRRACEGGVRIFDYGRSIDGTGSFAFKKNWGFQPTPLHYRFGGLGDAKVPDLTPSNPAYRLAVSAWKKLPVRVANRIGPLTWPFLA